LLKTHKHFGTAHVVEALTKGGEGDLDRLVKNVVYIRVDILLAVLFGHRCGRAVWYELNRDCLIKPLTRDLKREAECALKIFTLILEQSIQTPLQSLKK
jgi:hypothetical protein